jgi:hypothetical protein
MAIFFYTFLNFYIMADFSIINNTYFNIPFYTFFDPSTITFTVIKFFLVNISVLISIFSYSTFSDFLISYEPSIFSYSNILDANFYVTNYSTFSFSIANSLSNRHSDPFPLSMTNMFSKPFIFFYPFYAISSMTFFVFMANLLKI